MNIEHSTFKVQHRIKKNARGKIPPYRPKTMLMLRKSMPPVVNGDKKNGVIHRTLLNRS